MSTLRTFLDVLYADCPGVIECRALPSKARQWAAHGSLEPLGAFLDAQVAANQNLYVGVATRRDTSSGTISNLCALPAVWAELDRPPAEVEARLRAFPFEPSLVVHSGYGVHAYYKLREYADLREPGVVARVAPVLRRLCGALGGDDRATDPTRILRIPQTYNYKYDTPREVILASVTAATVNLSELEDVLPAEVIVDNAMTIESIPKGTRNDTLHRLGRRLRCAGRTLPELQQELESINQQWCQPPLDQDEFRRVVHSVWVQKDRADFVPPIVIHDATPQPPVPDGTAVTVTLASIEPEPVTWHWTGRLPAGKGVMIAGDPGVGKSMLLADIAARYTVGGEWPDGGRAPQGKVLLLLAEDGLADTVRPRIDAHGGDASQVEILTAIQDKHSERPFNLSRDLAALDEVLRRLRPKLLGIDPLNSYLGKVDSYRDADIRGVLSPLLASAERYGCVLAWIAHLTKSSDVQALYRPGASIGFVASARVVFVVGKHPQQPEQIVLAQPKNNLAPAAPSLSYTVSDGRVCWGGVVDLTADQILRISDPEEVEVNGTADALITELRADPLVWPLDVRVAYRQGESLDVPERSLRRAARRAGLTPFTKGFGRDRITYWFDPQQTGNGTGGIA